MSEGTKSLFQCVREARVIEPDPRSSTRFAPYVMLPPEARDALVAAVELVQRFRQWDDLPGRADGSFWMREADRVLGDLT